VDDGCFAMYPAGSGVNEWWNMPGARHNKGMTWTFADGHAEYIRWHGAVVPNAENNAAYTPYTQADPVGTSDDLPRVQAATVPYPYPN
jgi:prepilin-type processing-associated H-X9-DG protein